MKFKSLFEGEVVPFSKVKKSGPDIRYQACWNNHKKWGTSPTGPKFSSKEEAMAYAQKRIATTTDRLVVAKMHHPGTDWITAWHPHNGKEVKGDNPETSLREDQDYWKSMPHDFLHAETHAHLASHGLSVVNHTRQPYDGRETPLNPKIVTSNGHYHQHSYEKTTAWPSGAHEAQETFSKSVEGLKQFGWKVDHQGGDHYTGVHPNGSELRVHHGITMNTGPHIDDTKSYVSAKLWIPARSET